MNESENQRIVAGNRSVVIDGGNDTPLLTFSVEGSAKAKISILKIYEENRALLPLDLTEVSAKGVLNRGSCIVLFLRTVPTNFDQIIEVYSTSIVRKVL